MGAASFCRWAGAGKSTSFKTGSVATGETLARKMCAPNGRVAIKQVPPAGIDWAP